MLILQKIVELQKTANDKAKSDWLLNSPAYLRAAMFETIEGLDHINSWKWWKANSPNIEQAFMELVDIYHFVISEELVRVDGNLHSVVELLSEAMIDGDVASELPSDWEDFNMRGEQLAKSFIDRKIDYPLFVSLANTLGFSVNDLNFWYVGKNALNQFRSSNGYKDGTYIKQWFGKEDNDTLEELLNEFKSDDRVANAPEVDMYTFIYDGLTSNYAEVLKQNA